MFFCPDCDGERIHRHSHLCGMRRDRYRLCRRSFGTLTSTPLARSRHLVESQDDLNNMLNDQLV